MKIVFLNKYQFKVARGAETFVSELAQRFSQTHQIKIIADINYLKLLKTDFDVIIPTNGRFQVLITRIISWIKKAKMIVSGQSGAGFDDRLNLYSFPDAFVGLSKYQSGWAKKINPFVKVVNIPNGVDLDVFKRTQKNNKDYILSVGAFTKEKRHDLTIKAVSLIKEAKLVIAGSGGDQRFEIEKLCKELLPGRYKILTVEHSKMPDVFNNASVLAFPSVAWESFGIVMLEAMAMGVPVVANRDPIRREIVGDAGILVDPDNSEAYSEALIKAIATDWRLRPRKQAEKYSWDKISEAYEKLINEISK